MLTVNGITRGPQNSSFTYSELKAEAARRGIHLQEPVTREDLINALLEGPPPQRILFRKELIAFTTRQGELCIRNLNAFGSVYNRKEKKKAVGVNLSIVGATPSGEIVTFEEKEMSQKIPYVRVYNSNLELLREKRVSDSDYLRAQVSVVPQLTGNKLIFIDSVVVDGRDQVIKVVDVRTFEVRTLETKVLPGYDREFRFISAKDNYLLAHNSQDDTLSLWNLDRGEIELETSAQDIEVDYLFLIDPFHFCVTDTERGITSVYTRSAGDARREGKWNQNNITAGKGYGVCNGKFVTAHKHGIFVCDISGERAVPLYLVTAPLNWGEEPAFLTELRDSRVMFVTDDDVFVVIDLESERITQYIEGPEASDYYPLPPDEDERTEFRQFISRSMPQSVPAEIADIIEKFI
jgi:hypothetical protein